MRHIQRSVVLLVCIIGIAALLRLWQLGQVPVSPDWDEAAYGYNAFSVIQTGRDEFGAFLPVVLRSFDDYKPALYLYLVIPFVALLGVTVEAVRLPSALAGILTVYVTYRLVVLLFKRQDLALLTAFLLALSPWHIQFSRIGFEANVGILLNVSMVYFFLRGLKNSKFLIFAAIIGALSIYAYQSEKVFTPLLVFVLVGIYAKDLLQLKRKYLALAAVIGSIVVFPMLWYLLTNNQALTRARETSIFADKTNLNRTIARLDYDQQTGDALGKVLDNRRVFYAVKILDGYLSHFSLNWLFITGDNNPRHHAPGMSLLYLVELPFLLIGIYCFAFLHVDKKKKWLILLWFLISPIPASITSGVPHAVRTINFLPLFQLFTALGLLSALAWVNKYKRDSINYKGMSVGYSWLLVPVVSCYVLLAGFNVTYYLNQYFVQMNRQTSKDWQYGYEKAVPFVSRLSTQVNKIIVSNNEPLDQSYIFFLFYLRYNPQAYLAERAKNTSGGFAETHAFAQYEFRPIKWSEEKPQGKTLYVGRPSDFPDTVKPFKTITYLDGSPAIKIVMAE